MEHFNEGREGIEGDNDDYKNESGRIDVKFERKRGRKRRFRWRVKLNENPLDCSLFDNIASNIMRVYFVGYIGYGRLLNVDGVDYLLEIDLLKINNGTGGILIRKWNLALREHQVKALDISKNCVLLMMDEYLKALFGIIRIAPSRKNDKLIILNVRSARKEKEGLLKQEISSKDFVGNLKRINTKYGCIANDNKVIYKLPGIGLFIKRV